MLARDKISVNEMSWILIKVFFGSSYLGFDVAVTVSGVVPFPAASFCHSAPLGLTELRTDQPALRIYSNVSPRSASHPCGHGKTGACINDSASAYRQRPSGTKRPTPNVRFTKPNFTADLSFD